MARRTPTDYRGFKKSGALVPREPVRKKEIARQPGQGGELWWKMTEDAAAKGISSNLQFWGRNQRWRIQQLRRFARYYGNHQMMGYGAGDYQLATELRQQNGDQITINVSGSVTDTLVAKLTRNKPKPYFLTDDGDHKSQRIAKNRNTFITGVFSENKTYAKTRMSCQDACVWGDGIIYVSAVNGRVNHRRVLPQEIFIDEWEAAMYGGPRQLHYITFVDRAQLIADFPDKEKFIIDEAFDGTDYSWLNESLADLVCVRDSWHLPSAPGAKDGMYIKTIDAGPLTDPKPWTRDHFPFARFRYGNRPIGYWGQGLVEQGLPIAQEINKIAWTIQQNIEAVGGLKVFVPSGSNISVDQLTNDFIPLIEGTAKPEPLLWPPVQPEVYEYYREKKNEYYELAGIAQSDAASMKQPGDLSGRALELVHDIGTERFAAKGNQFEDFHCEIADLSIWTATEILEDAQAKAKEGERVGYSVTVKKRGTAKTVDFAELGFEPGEEWAIQCFPVSMLPFDPAGRTQFVQNEMQAGLIDPDVGRDLLDYPDTGHVEGLHNATREFCTRTLDAMIDKATPYELEPDDDGIMFFALAREYLQRYKIPEAKVPEKNLIVLRSFLQHLAALPENQPPGQSPPPPSPEAAPEPPPTSALLPNAPSPKMAA